jgi:uncharacterized membrane protein
MKSTSIVAIVCFLLLLTSVPVHALDTPVVHAVFFFNPECEKCHLVMIENLPPLQSQYGIQLEILQIDTSKPDGLQLYQAMVHHFQLPNDRLGTPAIVLDTTVLVGADEIATSLPGMVEEGLTAGGISWPQIPGLAPYLPSPGTTNAKSVSQVYPQPIIESTQSFQDENVSTWDRFSTNFKKDPIANSLAVVILVGMAISILVVLTILIRSILADNPTQVTYHIPGWFIPLLVVVGLGVAGYLTYIEVDSRQAVCGPVGHCNEVQNSPYAKLFGILPIGLLGFIGYAACAFAWGINKYGPNGLRTLSALSLWGMSLFGVAFSIYLTFLEPFIIGSTCMWCLSSALLITALLWVTTPLLQEILTAEDILETK